MQRYSDCLSRLRQPAVQWQVKQASKRHRLSSLTYEAAYATHQAAPPQVFDIMQQAVIAGTSSPAARNASGLVQCLPCYCRGLGTTLAQLGGEALIATKKECSQYLNTLDINVIMIRWGGWGGWGLARCRARLWKHTGC
jgi:hypothetical protein